MNEPFTLKGLFFLPESPENEVPGELNYSPETGVELILQGNINASNHYSFHHPKPQNVPLILGVTNKGKRISLVDCIQINATTSIDEYIYVTTSYHAHFAYIGIHFDEPEAVQFREIEVRFTHMDEWFDKSPFDVEYPVMDYGKPDYGAATLFFKKVKNQSVNIGDYTVTFSTSGPFIKHPSVSEYLVYQKTSIRIVSNSDQKSIGEFLTAMRRIQDFLTLGAGEPVYPIEMEGYSESIKEKSKIGEEYSPPIQIIYDRPWQPKPGRQIHAYNMLFTLTSIEDQLITYLNNWFSKTDYLKPVLDIYFSILYREQIYTEFRFLGIVQAIEAFHRRMCGGKYQPDDEFRADLYQKLVKAIPPDLDPAFRTALIYGKLFYANQYSLRKRLLELGHHLGSYLPFSFLANSKKLQAFIDDVCKTRNHLTHNDQDSTYPIAKTGKELYALFIKLRVMLDALLLEVIGFGQEQIADILKKNRFYIKLLSEP
mgnify:CR=1 FL=1